MSCSPGALEGGFLDPDIVPADVHRRAVRGLVLRADGRLLLERVHLPTDPDQGTWWETPGGGVEPGEAPEAALEREIREETGRVGLQVGPAVATRRIRYRSRLGEVVEQHETFHLVDPADARSGVAAPEVGEGETIVDLAWVGPDEIAELGRVDPIELVRVVLDGAWLPERLPDLDCIDWSDDRDGIPLAPSTVGAHLVDDGAQLAAEVGPLVDDGVQLAPDAAPGREGQASRRPTRVVRDAAPWTASVHALLAHLADQGFDTAPQPLGVDRFGREAVTYLDGTVSSNPGGGSVHWAAPLRTLDGMAAVGVLLRSLRAAVADFVPPPAATWISGVADSEVARARGPAGSPGPTSMAHGDVGWANLVWRADGTPALVDWEFAQPAEPLRDLAQAACWLVPLVPFDHEARGFDTEPDRRARLAVLARGAGVDVGAVLDAAVRYVTQETDRIRRWGGLGVEPWASLLARGSLDRFAELRDGIRRVA